ncbi:Hypothetical protein BSSP2_I0413 [Brucella suis bv. 2]|nr:Hypothetical protein BSPT1_I1317 [Brucella suis bv. 2]AIB24759.1 Hypothetical protein BSPT2_I1302 [Brucella suis bv. 2]AIB28155.1 Hypothetical protein BSSP1_I1305 [Brucella suis bv. 2]AIB30645.1 Hypothetical protein BSSP2_I0413 [Brucella suis bv. 2]
MNRPGSIVANDVFPCFSVLLQTLHLSSRLRKTGRLCPIFPRHGSIFIETAYATQYLWD